MLAVKNLVKIYSKKSDRISAFWQKPLVRKSIRHQKRSSGPDFPFESFFLTI